MITSLLLPPSPTVCLHASPDADGVGSQYKRYPCSLFDRQFELERVFTSQTNSITITIMCKSLITLVALISVAQAFILPTIVVNKGFHLDHHHGLGLHGLGLHGLGLGHHGLGLGLGHGKGLLLGHGLGLGLEFGLGDGHGLLPHFPSIGLNLLPKPSIVIRKTIPVPVPVKYPVYVKTPHHYG